MHWLSPKAMTVSSVNLSAAYFKVYLSYYHNVLDKFVISLKAETFPITI